MRVDWTSRISIRGFAMGVPTKPTKRVLFYLYHNQVVGLAGV